MSYSMDLRERVVASYEETKNKSEIARRYQISRWTVDRYIKRAEQGSLEAKSPPGPKGRLAQESLNVLKKQVKDHNDWTLEQHAEALAKATGISLKKSAIAKYFSKMGMSRKKRVLEL